MNFTQKGILADFMKIHTDLAKGILTNTAQGKAKSNQLWNTLTTKLNSSGPPMRDSKACRKVYADQKQIVKRKLAFNKASKKRTGGGPYEEKVLTIAEEQIVEAAGITLAVEGLKNVETFGCAKSRDTVAANESTSQETEEETESDTDESEDENVDPPSRNIKHVERSKTNKRTRETKTSLLKKNVQNYEDFHTQLVKKIDEIVALKKKSLDMKTREFEMNMEIKKIELQIKQKELERFKDI